MSKSGNELRQNFLDFFVSKGSLAIPSASLVPANDPTLLWINAGMAPLKPYFAAQQVPPNRRLASSQKCLRTNDIENVGHTARHHTLFEMLGNFSIGDYFKEDAIAWAWEFLTGVVGFDQTRLWATVHPTDTEAAEIWTKKIGMPSDHIVPLDDNFWDIGPGPCGPCSEIYYDRGPAFGCGSATCKPGCDCDRYLEVWNLVFSQFNHQEDGTYPPLPQKNIDTGMGLERLVSLVQDVPTNFETDLFMPYIEAVQGLTGVPYQRDAQSKLAMNVIADHIRAVTFSIADGVSPSNEGRGYVIRRLLRRAVRYGRSLGLEKPFLGQIVPVVTRVMGGYYPALVEKQDFVEQVVGIEEERFFATIDEGMTLLSQVISDLKTAGAVEIGGEQAFRLYDTYGFPLDITEDVAQEHGMEVDRDGFDKAMAAQRERARSARQTNGDFGHKNLLQDLEIGQKFLGYTQEECDSVVEAIIKTGERVDNASEGDEVDIVFAETVFYAESGGQVADTGNVSLPAGTVAVSAVHKGFGGRFLHKAMVTQGSVRVGDRGQLMVDHERRQAIRRAHTATHLLQRALRDVLGEHVHQAGSLVQPDMLRFDYTHFAPLTSEQIAQVEGQVYASILKGHQVTTEETTIDKARERGAMALFDEKYGDVVRLVCVGDYSLELCGGTHLNWSSEVGTILVTGEAGIGSGVRRIEAYVGKAAYEEMRRRLDQAEAAAALVKADVESLPGRVQGLFDRIKELERQNESLTAKFASTEANSLLESVIMIEEVPFISGQVQAADIDKLRSAADVVREKAPNAVVLLGAAAGEKVNFVAMAPDSLLSRGVHAGKLVGEVARIAGGGGGGRPTMAQAGGKDPGKLAEALSRGADILRAQLKH
jgi:alanyl-tRNA synthetase